MINITFEERTLMSLYNAAGTRIGLIEELKKMRGFLQEDEAELRELTDSSLAKLKQMSDEEYEELDLFPDFSELEGLDGE